MLRTAVLLVVLVLTSGCAKGTPQNPILPAGVTPTPLPQPAYVGLGKYQRLGETTATPLFGGLSYITFLEVRQATGSSIQHNDVPGFVYAYQGRAFLSRRDGELRDTVEAGKAAWVEADTEHTNPSSDEEVWYFVSFRPIGQRGKAAPY